MLGLTESRPSRGQRDKRLAADRNKITPQEPLRSPRGTTGNQQLRSPRATVGEYGGQLRSPHESGGQIRSSRDPGHQLRSPRDPGHHRSPRGDLRSPRDRGRPALEQGGEPRRSPRASPRGRGGLDYQYGDSGSPTGGAVVGAPVAASSSYHNTAAGGGGGQKGYEETPTVTCGCYWNEEDPRSCVCTKDECGRPGCAPNLGTPTGKLIGAMMWGAPVCAIIINLSMRGGGEEKEVEEREGRGLLQLGIRMLLG
ncbi:unnamed protein product [Amoebophrya sp. A25]|nr:unnamed protein product [Amoebophrya sp. A25]|eukprot:GSA25T00000641001.1